MSPYKSGTLFQRCGSASLAVMPDRLLEKLGSKRKLLASQYCLVLLVMVSFIAALVGLDSKDSTVLLQIAAMSKAQIG